MKIVVFGATGGTGKQIIEQALAAGHHVTAFARNPSKIGLRHKRLTVVQGELADAPAVARAVDGADTVLSALGPRPGEDLKPRSLSRGVQNILDAMRQTGVRRLILLSTPSARDPHDLPDFQVAVLVAIIKFALRPVYEEIISVAGIVRASDTDWTLVRVTLLNNKPKSGKIRAGYLGRKQVGLYISRADLAALMLQQIRDTTYVRQAPVVSN